MLENYTYKKCNSCKEGNKHTAKIPKKAGLISNILLFLLPKCPLCVMAYSSSLVLCSKEEVIVSNQIHSSLGSTLITVFFCMVVLVSIFLNFKDNRTKYALLLAFGGSMMIVASTIISLGPGVYFSGTAFIFFAIWLNGSLYYYIKKWRNLLNKLPEKLIQPMSET